MAQLPSTAMGAKRAHSQPPPAGELLEDRIRDGIIGSLNEQIAVGLQVSRALSNWHSKKRFLECLSSSSITIDEKDNVTLFGPESDDSSLRYGNAQALGVILFELFTGKLMADHDSPDPDLELLHKAGLPPALVEVVSQCRERADDPKIISRCSTKLQSILRERLGERASAPKLLPILLALVALAAAAFLAWRFLK